MNERLLETILATYIFTAKLTPTRNLRLQTGISYK